jgi:hypothetical protein
MNYDVIIIGAGPSGLFAAERLSHESYKTLIIDKKRIPGGAGALTDGKLVFHPRVGMDLEELRISEQESKGYADHIENYFLSLGINPDKISNANTDEGRALKEDAAKHNLEFLLHKTRHMGTDIAPSIMKKFKSRLEDNNIEFRMKTGVQEIKKENNEYELTLDDGEKLITKNLIVGPGRGNSEWWRNQADKLEIEYNHGPIQLGARIEVPKWILDPITDISYDAKFYFRSLSHNDPVRTFCVNPGGQVTLESKSDSIKINGDSYSLVNGHSKSDNGTENSNLAILVSLPLTEPETDPKEYIKRVIKNTYRLGDGEPLAQRWGDLKRGSRSKEETFFSKGRGFDRLNPTLNKYTPGDISLAFPERFYSGITEMIDQLDKIIPGFGHPSTLLYIPEAKFCDTIYKTKGKTMETSMNNLYAVGDGAGKSRGIVGAGLTGILAAEGIINKDSNLTLVHEE